LSLADKVLLTDIYRPDNSELGAHINLPDTVGKLFEKILLTMVLQDVKERGVLRDQQFGF
jgi:hypothetical protein